jgi:hypothetical protein
MHIFSASLIIAIKPKATGNFRTTAMFLFHIQQRNRSCIFIKDLLPHIMPGPYSECR